MIDTAKKNWRVLTTIFILVLVFGFLSAVSDDVYSPDGLTPFRWLLHAVAGIVNDFSVWLAVAAFVAWRWGQSFWAATCYALLFSVTATAAYLVISPLLRPGDFMVSSWPAYWFWGALAIAGGVVGGVSGYLSRRWPVALLPIAVLAVLRVVREPRAWQSSLGAAHHLTLTLLVAAITVYWVMLILKALYVKSRQSSDQIS